MRVLGILALCLVVGMGLAASSKSPGQDDRARFIALSTKYCAVLDAELHVYFYVNCFGA